MTTNPRAPAAGYEKRQWTKPRKVERTALRLFGLSAIDTFPSRNAISKAPRAAAIAVAISSIGTQRENPCTAATWAGIGGTEDRHGEPMETTLTWAESEVEGFLCATSKDNLSCSAPKLRSPPVAGLHLSSGPRFFGTHKRLAIR